MVFDDMFIYNTNIHGHTTRQSYKLHVTFCRSLTKSKTIRHKGVSIWNTITQGIELDCKMPVFKRRVRKFLKEHGAAIL